MGIISTISSAFGFVFAIISAISPAVSLYIGVSGNMATAIYGGGVGGSSNISSKSGAG